MAHILRRTGALNVANFERLRIRADKTEKWLREQKAADPFSEQRHLDAGTVERAYWHHGYLMALRDALAYLEERSKWAVEPPEVLRE